MMLKPPGMQHFDVNDLDAVSAAAVLAKYTSELTNTYIRIQVRLA